MQRSSADLLILLGRDHGASNAIFVFSKIEWNKVTDPTEVAVFVAL